MILRYAVRMSLYPRERWTGGAIPIFFHWVLAAYVLVLGWHHRRHAESTPGAARRRWWSRLAWWLGGSIMVAGLAVWVVYLLFPSLLAHWIDSRPPEFAVRIERSAGFTTSDGIQLVADIYHPQRAGPKTPTILVRLPYSKNATNKLFATVAGRMWAERGYTVVLQGTRGRYESGGDYYPLREERRDGIETLDWLARQPWFDGRLGMWGCSYYAYTQWVLADRKNPGPRALLIQECSTDMHGMFYHGGAFSLKSALYWAVMSHGTHDVTPAAETLQRGFNDFPLLDADDRAATEIPFFNDWVLHHERDDYWARIDGDHRPQRLQAPVLMMAGWYDPFLPTQLDDFCSIGREADPRIAAASRLIVGPWAHAETVTFPDGTAPRNFRLEMFAPSIAWFDQHVMGAAAPPAAPVRIYTMGTHQWRDEQEWPLARTRYTPYYLHSKGQANTAAGDGTLSQTAPTDNQPTDTFIYDPRDPAPTAGGAMLGQGAGIVPQNDVEARPDVLVYTTAALDDDLEVTGPIHLTLHVATSAPCTDFTAKLVDVYPDGSAYNISDGILRRRYERADASTEIKIVLWPTSNVFLKGHRIRLEVSSSNYPRFDRNPNTGGPIATETTPITATQTVRHTALSPSRLVLPIVARPRVGP
jgi:hypothetical protein